MMRERGKLATGMILAAASLTVLVGIDAQADEDQGEVRELRKMVKELTARVSALEAEIARFKGQPPKVAPEPPAEGTAEAAAPEFVSEEEAPALRYGSERTFVEIHGFADLEYLDAGSDGPSHTGFDSHHANIFFHSQMNEKLDIDLELEHEHAGSEIELDRAEMAWKVLDSFKFTAGRFYEPFGIERRDWYPPKNRFVTRPMVMREIIPGTYYADGLEVSGDISLFKYELAVSNGLGDGAATDRRESRQSRDNNNNRTVAGRIGFGPIHGFEAGASYSTGKYDADDRYSISFAGVDLSYRIGELDIRSEYVTSDVEASDADGGNYNQDGFYLQAAYRLLGDSDKLSDLTLFGRYGAVDLNDTITDSGDKRRFSFGASVSPFEHYRFKLEYQLNREDGGVNLDNDALRLQVVLDF